MAKEDNMFECETEEEIEESVTLADSSIRDIVKEHMATKLGTRLNAKVLYLKRKAVIEGISVSVECASIQEGETIAVFPEIKGRSADHCAVCRETGFGDINIETVKGELVASVPSDTINDMLKDYNLRKVNKYTPFQQKRRWSKLG
jgi:hypothetical protein